MRAVIASAVVAVMLAAGPASAQDPEKRVHFNFGSGATISTGELNNHLGSGYNLNFGVTINVTPKVGILAEYSFNGMGQKQVNVDVVQDPIAGAPGAVQAFYGDMNMQYGAFNAVFKPMPEARVNPYVTGGVGIYYRPIKVTTPAIGWVPGYCDPFWYYCSPGGYVPVDAIVGSRSTTDFGMDFGAGVNVKLGSSAAFYVEGRYHYIWGPSYKDASGNSKTANGQFFPITFGLRF